MRYEFNDRFFESIDTEQKAYWLGFITADGYVYDSNGNYGIELGLAEKDEAHVKMFLSAIGHSTTGQYRVDADGNKSFRASIYSKYLVEDLNKYGVCSRKSFTSTPAQIEPTLAKHYWRGMFDGDGGFSIVERQRKSGKTFTDRTAYLVGTKAIVDGFQNFIICQSNDEYKVGTIHPHSSIWRIYYSGIRPSQTVAKMLYSNALVYLPRKKELADAILSATLRPPIIQQYKADTLMRLRDEYGSWTEVAKYLQVSRVGLYKHIAKLDLPRRRWTKNVA